MSFSKQISIAELIKRHRALDKALTDGRDSFVSEWNCDHPFVDEFLGPMLAGILPEVKRGEYIYLDERPGITQAAVEFHQKRESLKLSRKNVLAGAGSSSLLAAFVLWLINQGVRQVHYLPPIYHTLHFFFQLLGIEAIPVSRKHAFQPNFDMRLPERSGILFLSDPIWYAGKRLPREMATAIGLWQERTGSLVFVDGSFQYLSWNKGSLEETASLNQELTFRLVCPTKALAVHSYRFSYLLHPSRFHSDLTFLYENLVGSVAGVNLAFGIRALQLLATERSNHPLAEFLRETFEKLCMLGVLRTEIRPDCGYYVFAVPLKPVPNQVAMGQEYFELAGYPDHVRVNLMAAHRIYLS
jgi:aspartate/methionine/tyrosine aminotransferase